jgi:hypothetical protein
VSELASEPFDTGLRPSLPEARALRRMVRSARAARSTTTLRQRIGNGYEVALTVLIVGGLGIQAGRRLIAAASSEAPAADSRVVGWLLVALTMVLAGLAVRGLTAIGPLFAGPATQTWLLSTPVSRAGLLSWWYRWTLLASAVVGLGYGVLASRLGGTGLVEFFLCAATGSLLAVALAAWSVRQQAARSRRLGRLGVAAVVAGLLLALLVGALRLLGAGLPGVAGWPVGALCVALVLAVTGIWASARVRGWISRAALSEGAALAGATSVAVSWFDPTLLTGLLTQRRLLRVASVRSTRLRSGSRALVLLGAELRRLVRSRSATMAWATLLVVPYPLAAVISPVWMPVVQVVGATLAADRLAGGLRTVCRSASIRRTLGGSDRQIRLVHLVIPACGALAWSALTLPVVWSAGWLLGVLYPATAATLVVYRMANRRAMDYNLAATVDPAQGVLPIGLLFQLARGPDLLLLFAAVRILLG